MALGGRRAGSGGKPGNQNAKKIRGDGRVFARDLVDDPENRQLLTAAFKRALRGKNAAEAVATFDRIFQVAYGRPPQALAVTVNDGRPIVHRVTFGDAEVAPGGDPRVSTAAGLPVADDAVGGTD